MTEMKNILKILIVNILVGITMTMAIRYGSDYIYSRFSSEGLTPTLPYTNENNEKSALVDVYLIPFDGFPESVAEQLSNILSKELQINIKTALSAPLDKAVFNEKRQQYSDESLYDPITQVIPVLKNQTDKTAYIALLNADMYPQNGDWNYMFSAHWDGRISVVATGRLIPYGVFSRGKAQEIYGTLY